LGEGGETSHRKAKGQPMEGESPRKGCAVVKRAVRYVRGKGGVGKGRSQFREGVRERGEGGESQFQKKRTIAGGTMRKTGKM